MDEQNPHPTETSDATPTEQLQVGWGFWVLWVLALAAAGALSYCLGSVVPLAHYTLPPATMLAFGSMSFSIWQGYGSLGIALVIGVGACFLTTVIILPGIIGWLERKAGSEEG